jgi:hypothetical protein
MGTTLTGTTPQDTYDSLIKVTDNGPISGTLKALSDGLGNDSTLSLSTTAASIAGTLAVAGNATFDTNTLFVDAANNAVGIGTTSVFAELQINKASDVTLALSNSTAVTSGNRGTLAFYNSGVSTVALIRAAAVTDNVGTELQFHTRPAAGSVTQQMTITSAGSVGIGTSAPDGKLDVASAGNLVSTGAFTNPHLALTATATTDNDSFVGITYATSDSANFGWSMGAKRETGGNGYLEIRQHFNSATGTEIARFTGNGLCFGSDTAAANALDDYEEGTFTATITPATSGTITSGATFTTWTYTKIGRQVTINGVFVISSVASPVGATVVIGGLPFTILNNNGAYGAYSAAYFTAATSTNSAVAGRHAINSTQLTLGVDASTVAASDEIYVTATYFV